MNRSDFNEDYLVASPDYAGVMNQDVIPWLETIQQLRTVPGAGDAPLYTVSYPAEAPIATALIVHGFTENAFKYQELIHSLLRNGFCVVAWDQRGHGRSYRAEGIPDPSVTHVDAFDEYVEDMKILCSGILPGMPGPYVLFAHSMGGAIASLFLEQEPDLFSAAALCAPMIAPNTGGLPAFLSSAVCRTAILFGRGRRNPFFMKPYAGPEDFETSCATDAARFAWYDEVKASRPEFQNSVPSYGWVAQSVSVTRRILAPGAPESIRCPVLLSTADRDFSVLPGPQKAFISRVPKGQHLFVPGSRHEIYRSTNDVLFPWWHRILSFLKGAPD